MLPWHHCMQSINLDPPFEENHRSIRNKLSVSQSVEEEEKEQNNLTHPQSQNTIHNIRRSSSFTAMSSQTEGERHHRQTATSSRRYPDNNTRKRERFITLSSSIQPENQNQDKDLSGSDTAPRKNNAGSIPLPRLPDELIVEILSRLPVKFLLKFRCVCKSWKFLIFDPYFIKKHLLLSTQNTNFTHHRIILSSTTAEFNLKSCSLSSLFKNPSTISDDLNYPVKNRFRHDGIIGSCNGLLCFAIKGDRVLLWNPSIRVYKKSPPLGNNWRPGCYTAFGLGFDHVTDDYKVVAVFCDPNLHFFTKVKVLSVASNSWRKIQDFPYGVTPYHNFGKFVSSSLNWAANCSSGSNSNSSWVIVSMDLRKETYKEVLPPEYEKEECSTPTLGVLKEFLCMNYDYRKTHSVLWLMKEYGVRESWVKLVSIPYLPNPEDFSYSMPYCISENGEVLIMFEFDLVLYNPGDQSFRFPRIESGKGWFDAEVYVETLVSPIKD